VHLDGIVGVLALDARSDERREIAPLERIAAQRARIADGWRNPTLGAVLGQLHGEGYEARCFHVIATVALGG
jgi:hypothetical protein